jgi:hypothetical protein
MADLVTVTTPELKKIYGGGGKAEQCKIIPNYVPQAYLDIEVELEHRDRPVIGWTGSVDTHPNDLQQVGGWGSRLRRGGRGRRRKA